MSLKIAGDLVAVEELPAPTPQPKKKRIVRRLKHAQARERAILCAKMIAAGKHNSAIKKACKKHFHTCISDKLITDMRQGKYIGVGAEVFEEGYMPPAKSLGKTEVKNDNDTICTLRDAFSRCLRLMHAQDITSAHLDAVKDEVQVEVRATRRISL